MFTTLTALAAQTEVEPLVAKIQEGLDSGAYHIVVGAVVMLLVAFARPVLLRLLDTDKTKAALPWVSAAIGMLVAFASGLLGGIGWIPSLMVGFVTGAAASGFWSLLGKHALSWLPWVK